MKKYSLVFLLALLPLSLVSCNKNDKKEDQTEKDYSIVKFNLNYGDNEVYENRVVSDGKVLNEPLPPFRDKFAFGGWFLDKACTQEYVNFGQAISADFELYAKWDEYTSLTDVQKIDYFIDVIGKLEGKVNKTVLDDETLQNYYFVGDSGYSFYTAGQNIFNRYTDIVTEEIYSYTDENLTDLVKIGDVQYFIEGDNIYQVSVPIDPAEETTIENASIGSIDLETFFNIGFTNLNLSSLLDLRNYLANPSENYTVDEYDISGLDITGFTYDEIALPISYSFDVLMKGQDDLMLQDIYEVSGTINFVNKYINRSTILENYGMAMDGGLLATISRKTTGTYTRGDFSTFSGTRFDVTEG